MRFIIPSMNAPDDLLALKDAAKLVPSARGGNRGVHVNTVKRWILAGRLRHWKVGPYMLVSRADVFAMLKPVVVAAPPVPTSATTDDILRRHGLLR